MNRIASTLSLSCLLLLVGCEGAPSFPEPAPGSHEVLSERARIISANTEGHANTRTALDSDEHGEEISPADETRLKNEAESQAQ